MLLSGLDLNELKVLAHKILSSQEFNAISIKENMYLTREPLHLPPGVFVILSGNKRRYVIVSLFTVPLQLSLTNQHYPSPIIWHVSKYNRVSRELTLLWHTVNPALLTVQTAEILKQIRVKSGNVWREIERGYRLKWTCQVTKHLSVRTFPFVHCFENDTKYNTIVHFVFYRFRIKPGVWDLCHTQ